MERIDELLPGIEEFLSETLASEKLSPFAEQRRLFFLERLDIVKLPPTVPPREGRNVPQELLKDTEGKSGIPSSQSTTTTCQQPDFAATQREISRSWRGTGSHLAEERDEVPDGDDDSLEKVKVYDDIDILDDSSKDDTDHKERRSVDNPYDGDDIDERDRSSSHNNIFEHGGDDGDGDDNGENDYEIPVAMQLLSDDGGSHPSLPMAESTEELHDDVIESAATMGPPPVPPPLPPRRDIRFSDSGSRSSINGLTDEAPPDLPFRPSLPRRGEVCGRSERSDRSDPDASGDGDSTSYESFDDEDEDPNNCGSKSNRNNGGTMTGNASIKLPTKPSKKKTLKMSKKMPKSKSLSQWEISAPFRKLDNIDVSGELLHKGKLTWNRRLVAITNGCLAMYKPDKDGRPMSVIPLMGYEATVTERKDKGRGFEIKMTHPQDDTHLFSVDVKDWAYAWKEHINNNSRGQRSSTGTTVRLSRAMSGDLATITPGTETLTQNNSNTGSHGSKFDENFRHSWADDDDYDEICVRNDNVFFNIHDRNKTEYQLKTEGIKESSSLKSESHSTPTTPVAGHGRRAWTLSRCQAFRSSVKSINNVNDEQGKDNSISSILQRRKLEFQRRLGPPLMIGSEILKPPKSAMSLSRLDWKSVLYNWSTPFDQAIMTLRRYTDLNGSNSNLSTGSEGGKVDDVVVRPRLRSGNKVMRMGSFAFRATQFFENISKKTSVKRKQSSQSYTDEPGVNNNNSNISKPRGVSIGSQDSALSGNNNNNGNNNHSNILEESSISSNSTTNLPHSPLNTPTSDLSIPVFSDSNSNLSNSPMASPGYEDINKRHGSLSNEIISADAQKYLQDVTHKGYLFIFSTFNRRRWGKRWCLVRDNYFECYRSENQPVSQCELNFLLKACVMRRAVKETNSDLALMLVEMDTLKEKITVEPVNDKEMRAWVQVLMAETSTPSLPEGLEEHMKSIDIRRGSDAPSVLSLSVLKQWDMDITLQSMGASNSSSDKNSPEDENPSPAEPLTPTPEMETSPSFVKESSPPLVDDSIAHIKKKHTTDSGFYSVKGNNSDSDGEHVDSVHTIHDLDERGINEDLNCGFSVVESQNFNHSKKNNENSNVHQSNNGDSESTTILSSENVSSQPSVNMPNEFPSNIPHSDTLLSSPSSLPMSQASSVSSSQIPPCMFHPSSFNNTQSESSNPPHNLSQISERRDSNASNISKDEYTLVVKRSLRRKNKPAESNVSTQDNNLNQNNELNNIEESSCTNDLSTVENSSTPEMMMFGCPKSDEETEDEEPPPIPPCESIYEDVEVGVCDSTLTNSTQPPSVPVEVDENEDNNSQKLQCNEDKFDHLIQSLEDEKNVLGNRPSTSSISDILNGNAEEMSGTNSNESRNQTENTSSDKMDNDDVITASEPPSITAVTPSKLSITLISDEITPCKPTDTSISLSEYNNGGQSSNIRTKSSSSTSSCHSPELPLVEVHKPGMTEDELREAIEGLKQKKARLKRKRLAVHDKRQRVSSDEERLACEKEFASLEREVESTDNDIGFLQNQLDALSGPLLEAIKINNKKKGGSGKKRKSKKKAH